MSFLSLYQFAKNMADRAAAFPGPRLGPDGQPRAQVEINDLIAEMIRMEIVEQIDIDAVYFDPEKTLGHIKVSDRRAEREDPADRLASIRVHSDLSRCWFRFVVCKELMHLFDGEDEVTFDVERFKKLLDEIENPPLRADASPMFETEFTTEWRALLVLCPLEHRNAWKARLEADEVSEMELATHFRIPLDTVSALCSQYYEEMYQDMVQGPLDLLAAESATAEADPNDPL